MKDNIKSTHSPMFLIIHILPKKEENMNYQELNYLINDMKNVVYPELVGVKKDERFWQLGV